MPNLPLDIAGLLYMHLKNPPPLCFEAVSVTPGWLIPDRLESKRRNIVKPLQTHTSLNIFDLLQLHDS